MDIDSNTSGQRQGEQTTNRYTTDNVRALLAELYSLGYGFSHIAKQVGLPVSWLSQLVRAKRTLCSPTLLEAIGKLAEKSLSVAREISVPPVAPRRLRIEAGLSLTAAVEHLKKEGFTRGAGQLAAIEKRPRGSWFRFAPEEWRELAGLYARYKPIAEEIRERYEKLNPHIAFCEEIAARLRVSAEELGLFLAQKRGLAPDRLEGLRRVILELEGETWLRDITPAWVEKQLQRRRESQAKAAGRLARQLRLGQHYIRGTALAKFFAGKRKLPYAIAKALWKYLCSDESNGHNQQPAGMEVVAALRQRCHNLGRYVNLRCEIVRRCKSKISKNTLKWFWIHGGNLRPRDCALVNEALDAIQNESPWLNVLNPEWLNNQLTILKLSLTEAAKLLRRKLGHRGKIHQTLVAFLAGKRRLYYPMAKAIWELFSQTSDSRQPPVIGDVIRRTRKRYRELGRYVMIAGEIARRTQPRLRRGTIVWFADRAFTCELLPSEVNAINEALDKLESEYPWLRFFTPDWAKKRIHELGLEKAKLWEQLGERLRYKTVELVFEAFLARGSKLPFRYAAALVEVLEQPSQAATPGGNGIAGDANQLVRRRGRMLGDTVEVELQIYSKAKELGLIRRGRKIKDDADIPKELLPLLRSWYIREKRKKYPRIKSVSVFKPAECFQVVRRRVHDVRRYMQKKRASRSG
jgi:hypothetical protein